MCYHGYMVHDPHSLYKVDPETSCWVWLRTLSPQGRARLWRKGYSQLAAHYFYIEKHGPVPKGLELDHLCQNKACVNPGHLEAVPHHVNVWRAPGTKLTPEKVVEIRQTYAADPIDQTVFAARYGLKRAHMNLILTGRCWKHAGGPLTRVPKGPRQPFIKMTHLQVREARARYEAGGVTQKGLAEEYGVSPRHMHDILKGKHR